MTKSVAAALRIIASLACWIAIVKLAYLVQIPMFLNRSLIDLADSLHLYGDESIEDLYLLIVLTLATLSAIVVYRGMARLGRSRAAEASRA